MKYTPNLRIREAFLCCSRSSTAVLVAFHVRLSIVVSFVNFSVWIHLFPDNLTGEASKCVLPKSIRTHHGIWHKALILRSSFPQKIPSSAKKGNSLEALETRWRNCPIRFYQVPSPVDHDVMSLKQLRDSDIKSKPFSLHMKQNKTS